MMLHFTMHLTIKTLLRSSFICNGREAVKLKAGVSQTHLKAHLLTLFLNRSSSALALLRLCWCCSSSFWEGGGAVGRAGGVFRDPFFNPSPTPMPSRLPSFDGGRNADPSDSSLSSSLEDCWGTQDRCSQRTLWQCFQSCWLLHSSRSYNRLQVVLVT